MITFVFIRHAKTIPEKNVLSYLWDLDQDGEGKIAKIANLKIIQELDYLYASTEKKAIETAKGVTKKLPKMKFSNVVTDPRIREVDRSRGKFYENPDEFKMIVKESFENKDQSIHNWESCVNALNRFIEFIRDLELKYASTDVTIGIVSHGTIMALYFAKIGNYYSDVTKLFKMWEDMPFCAWGIITDNKIIRNLA